MELHMGPQPTVVNSNFGHRLCPRKTWSKVNVLRKYVSLDPHLCNQCPRQLIPSFNSIRSFENNCHVPSTSPETIPARRRVKGNHRYKPFPQNSFINVLHKHPKTRSSPSSGQSTPQSSHTSLIFSSSGSNSSRSPPSSHNSFVEVSPNPSVFVRRQPRIQVADLLLVSHTRTYHLEVVQHPLRTAEFGTASLSRLPLTPPIIVQLTVRDPSGNSVVPESELPFLIAHLSLFSENGLTPLDMGSSIGRQQSPPILYGNLVSSIDQLEDLQGNMGLFFIFPDVSIRCRGRFQLGISLLRISSDPSGGLSLAEHGIMLAEARTRPFDVLAYSQYTAAPQTRLTQCFLRQGARMFTFMSHLNQ
ncbi:velvet factor-domain-containing protein [Infundibulicybe gibba]|nr:velvet factor-domain-containing protein [Infundibulicybe gibba]